MIGGTMVRVGRRRGLEPRSRGGGLPRRRSAPSPLRSASRPERPAGRRALPQRRRHRQANAAADARRLPLGRDRRGAAAGPRLGELPTARRPLPPHRPTGTTVQYSNLTSGWLAMVVARARITSTSPGATEASSSSSCRASTWSSCSPPTPSSPARARTGHRGAARSPTSPSSASSSARCRPSDDSGGKA